MSELESYDYDLPRELVAQEPLACRTDARLLVVDRRTGTIEHRHVRDLSMILQAGDHLVLNDTRVVPARLVGYRTQTRGRWQGLFLTCDEHGFWKVLAKTRGKPSVGETVTLCDHDARDDVRLRLIARDENGAWIVRPEPPEDASRILERIGRVPLPHYIRDGEMVPADWHHYQTVFARRPGSVAAPTAGLHFTKQLLADLHDHDLGVDWVTLHVGIDTFRPIESNSLDGHAMHSEWSDLSQATADTLTQCRAAGGRVVAVGTTTVRVLETAAQRGEIKPWSGPTRLFIRPPYTFNAVDVLLTNFHLPRTTLLVLVHAFGGAELIRRAYEAAIAEEYRFYSYGDAMLVL